MNISSAIFDRSAPDLSSCPDESLPEFAFIGRSNVGKSSLLNMLTKQDKLARVSPTPGFTKLINFFTINDCWRLVDLPGYGFAQVARADKARFNVAVAEYLEHRPNLRGVFALVDSMLTPQKIDLEFVEWLAVHSIPFVLVFTKIDRQSAGKTKANIAAFTERLPAICETLPDTFSSSATTGEGRRELLDAIENVLGTGGTPDQAGAACEITPDAPQPRRADAGLARRPNPSRPW